jgi:uncharacterized protein (TIGR02145 family)
MKKKYVFILGFIFPFIGLAQLFTPGSGVTDIDGNNYSTIIINGQEWMAENLRTSTYANGDQIPNITDNTAWSNLTSGAWAHYNNDIQYETPYGKLYNWYTTVDSRNVCPSGWHIPEDAEYTNLIYYLDPSSFGNSTSTTAGDKMKSVGAQYWACSNPTANNSSGFTALAGGIRGPNGLFNGLGWDGTLWSSTEFDNGAVPLTDAWYRTIDCGGPGSTRAITSKKQGWTLRCIKSSAVGIQEIKPFMTKELLKIVNNLGQETLEKPNELLFYIYNDGSVEKKVIVEK